MSTVIGIIVGIGGYFLKKTMDDLDKTKELSNKTATELEVLKTDHLNKHEHLSDKFDDLKDSIVVLTKEIKELTSKIK
jgi:predicted  nucleic acid-binding Zn-ribbon protein